MIIPDSVEDVEWIVELGLLWVVLDSEEACVAEVDPRDNSQTKYAVARWTLIDIQHQSRVEKLSNRSTRKQLEIEYFTASLHFSFTMQQTVTSE